MRYSGKTVLRSKPEQYGISPQKNMSAAQTTKNSALAQVRLLLVDDEGDFRCALGRQLAHRGLRFTAAACCAEALRQLELETADVVLMDMQMPETDGITCLRQIKERWPLAEVVLLTGHASVQSGIAGMESGAFDYCIKPIDVPDLLDKLELAAQKALINRESSG